MADDLTRLDEGFWRVRGSFRVGPIDVGTQCSLARLSDGGWVMLDSYTLPGPILAQVREITGGKLRAIVNLHPFHTLHCEWAHHAFPEAAMFGTARHQAKLPALPWQAERCEDGVLAREFGDSFAFSQPAGVPLVCADESVHFSSILALHLASGTIHVDDTLVYLVKGFPLSLLPMTGRLGFHPTLAKALEPRAGAAAEFRAWARALGRDWQDARRIAAAHNAVLELPQGDFSRRLDAALTSVETVLASHEAKHG